MTVRLIASLTLLSAILSGCSESVPTQGIQMPPPMVVAVEPTATLEPDATPTRTPAPTPTPTPTVPLQAAAMPARESATAEVVGAPVVSARPTAEPTATTEPGGEMDTVRIPRDVLMEAFEDALLGSTAHLEFERRFLNVSELPKNTELEWLNLERDMEFEWLELSWRELTYMRGRWAFNKITEESTFVGSGDILWVNVYGNGVGESPVQGSGKEVHDLYVGADYLRASGDEIWWDEWEGLRNLLNTVFNGNLAEMGVDEVEIHGYRDIVSPYSDWESLSEDDIYMHVRGEMDTKFRYEFSSIDLDIVFFSREGYHVWIAASGMIEGYHGDYSKGEYLTVLVLVLDNALIGLLDEYP